MLDLEVYDEFPNVALLSVSVRNVGQSEVALDWVTLQRHQFSNTAASHSEVQPLWTFQGASLKWGKDEIFHAGQVFARKSVRCSSANEG